MPKIKFDKITHIFIDINLPMSTICSICGVIPKTITHTFKDPETNNWIHFCENHLDNINKKLIHLPLPDELTGCGPPHIYSGLCKICTRIGHTKCLGFYPLKPHSW